MKKTNPTKTAIVLLQKSKNMNQSLRSMKNVLRKEMRILLNQIPSEVIEYESSIVTEKLINSKEYLTSNHISVYISMPKAEISTKHIIKDIFEREKICYVPRWNNDEMEMVKLNSYKDYLSLPVNRWNIPEPGHDEVRDIANELDLIIMPGLAFDHQGNRLGHGKGYYDKYLTKCQQIYQNESIPKTIALALDSQILKDRSIPISQYDQKPDLIISYNNIIQK
ncbi:5-formyltetrahydrofolate cyclo-ligase isoform X1 [Rhizophagus clarus]|uniref:5-formyltetrahydrofolate cyclo-ligase n=1 Tax=Rhizophagus clarus TaxID=94130 RepID=A0A8H3LTD3_9GLOM|nr:5-formyltetrahydrofolate cyclo-ligase isoform X1 [Rhizophagus clarus]